MGVKCVAIVVERSLRRRAEIDRGAKKQQDEQENLVRHRSRHLPGRRQGAVRSKSFRLRGGFCLFRTHRKDSKTQISERVDAILRRHPHCVKVGRLFHQKGIFSLAEVRTYLMSSRNPLDLPELTLDGCCGTSIAWKDARLLSQALKGAPRAFNRYRGASKCERERSGVIRAAIFIQRIIGSVLLMPPN